MNSVCSGVFAKIQTQEAYTPTALLVPHLRVIVQVALVKQRRVVIVAPRHAQEREDQDDGGVEVASQMLVGLGQPCMHRLHRRYQQARLEDGQKEPSRQREVHLRVALLAQHPEEGPRVHPPGQQQTPSQAWARTPRDAWVKRNVVLRHGLIQQTTRSYETSTKSKTAVRII